MTKSQVVSVFGCTVSYYLTVLAGGLFWHKPLRPFWASLILAPLGLTLLSWFPVRKPFRSQPSGGALK